MRYSRIDEYQKTTSFLHVRDRGDALDIGCSGGRYSYGLARNYQYVVGMDTSGIALQYTQNNPEKTRGTVNFVRGDALRLPFSARSFDCVLCIELIHHFTDDCLVDLIKDVAVVLKPGGVFIFDLKNKNNPLIVDVYKKGSQDEYPRIARTIGEVRKLLDKESLVIEKRVATGNLGVLPVSLAPIVMVMARKGSGITR